ncbi:MAG: hypothetical protein HY286_13635 [Planctomycetes bacterium]|nr:hypothetical protein [Planctomycetota bacterium]
MKKKRTKGKSIFALSLPERAVRSVVGTAGATAREITNAVVPPAVRGTRFWNAAVDRSLNILAEGIGNVKSNKKTGSDVDVARQAVGSVVDTAAMVVFHVSPLWLLAVVHDVASGSRKYLDEVVLELRERGSLEKDVNIHNIDHLLTVLENTAGNLQGDVDRPPLSVGELRGSVDRIRESMSGAPPDEVREEALKFGKALEEISKKEGRSPREISNAMAIRVATSARLAGNAAVAGVDVAARLFVVKGWRPYQLQLRSIARVGFARYLGHAVKPIADAVVLNFNPHTDTLTAKLLTGRLWRSAVAKLRAAKKK